MNKSLKQRLGVLIAVALAATIGAGIAPAPAMAATTITYSVGCRTNPNGTATGYHMLKANVTSYANQAVQLNWVTFSESQTETSGVKRTVFLGQQMKDWNAAIIWTWNTTLYPTAGGGTVSTSPLPGSAWIGKQDLNVEATDYTSSTTRSCYLILPLY